jgi:prepilin-type N-terminal cleavage/methylation domain-containing protein
MRRAGFTLIEILVVVAIMGIASVYMLGSISSSNRAYVVVDQVAESQQGMRAVAQLLYRDLRAAGMMVPRGAALCADDSQAAPDTLYVSDAGAIEPGDDLDTYAGARVQGGTTNINGTGNPTTLTVDSLILEPTPPTRAAYDADNDGVNDSDFQVGGGAIVIDLDNLDRGAACGTVEAVNLATPSVTVRTVSKALGSLAGTAQLVVVPAHEYRIVNGDQIQRDGNLLAAGVEDLQLAYFLDANRDNVIDPGEMHGTGAGANANFDAQDTDMSDLREVRLNLVVRTRSEDRDFAGQPEAIENRPAGAADGYRRRVYTDTVRLRNLARALGI